MTFIVLNLPPNESRYKSIGVSDSGRLLQSAVTVLCMLQPISKVQWFLSGINGCELGKRFVVTYPPE